MADALSILNGNISTPAASRTNAAWNVATSGVYSPQSKAQAQNYLVNSIAAQNSQKSSAVPTAATSQTVNGGNSGSAGSSASYSDPYSAWGGTAAYNSLLNGFNNQKSSIYSSADDAANVSAANYNNSILDLLDSLKSGQTSIDNRAVNNELAKQRGVADILGSINRGVQSGMTTLANKNATDSSAAEDIARAYGDIGQRQLSDVGNQYELENQDINLAQQDLDTQRAAGLRKLSTSKDQMVASIVADAQNSLSALDAAMANASLPDRIAIDAEKNNIRQSALAKLSQYDSELSNGVNGIQATSQADRLAEATRRNQLGQAGDSSFNYTTDTPATLQGTGTTADLPIFSYAKRDGS